MAHSVFLLSGESMMVRAAHSHSLIRFIADNTKQIRHILTLPAARSLAQVLAATAMIGAACDAPESAAPIEGDMEPVYRSHIPAEVDDANDLASYVAQCEAVLGPIPEINCDPENPAPGTEVTKIPVFLEGALLAFGEAREGDQTALAERAESGNYTCDFPSIGGDFACTVGSTLVHYQSPDNPNVQWVGLCRGVQRDNPDYDRFIGNGLIGANEKTGEMCFFFGSNPDPEENYTLPALRSDVESSDELSPWLPPRDMPGSCLSCHPNNDPWVLTPWLQPSYMASVLTNPEYPLSLPEGVELDDVLAARFIRQTPAQYKTMLPEPLPPGRTAWTEEEIFDDEGTLLRRQYRAVGSSYVDNESKGLVKTRTGVAPDSWTIPFRDRLRLHTKETSCAGACHAIGNANWANLAKDSLGDKYADKYLSDLMKAEDAPGRHWMPPFEGDPNQWQTMFENGEATVPAITECPIPKQLKEVPSHEIVCPSESEPGFVDVMWTYVNDYGDVPGRDDVRFDVAFGDPPMLGLAAADMVEGTRMDASDPGIHVLRDVAAENGTVSDYSVRIPFGPQHSDIAIDVQPKRFCFEEPDRRPYAYAKPQHLEIDVASACD